MSENRGSDSAKTQRRFQMTDAMRKQTKATALTFFAGFQAFHALTHAFLSLSRKTKLEGHPIELLGINANRKFHAIAAIGNAALAIALGIMARKSIREPESSSLGVSKFQRDRSSEALPMAAH
jgi:hypothetical protein